MGTRSTSLDAVAGVPVGVVLDLLPVAVVITNANGRVLCANASARATIPGLDQDAALADCLATSPAFETGPPADPVDWLAAFAWGESAEPGSQRLFPAVQCTNRDGDPCVLDARLDVIGPGERAANRLLLLSWVDVSRRVELEHALSAAESLAAVGRLAARVAHELNNPLDGSLRFLKLTERVLDDGDRTKAPAYLQEAGRGLRRMARIVSDLLEFSRSTPNLIEQGSVNRVVEEALHTLTAQADRQGVMVAASFHDENAMPRVEGTRLFQVCCNLIKNALDAMPDGGELTLTTGLVDDDVVIRVEDTGAGLPADADQLFQAFYTTKPTGQGTGLGLAICKEYVEQTGGTITAENGADQGAVFTVRVPRTRCADGMTSVADAIHEPTKGSTS